MRFHGFAFKWSDIANENDENAMRFIKNSHSLLSLNPYDASGGYSGCQKWDSCFLPPTNVNTYPTSILDLRVVYVDNSENGIQSKAKTIVKAHAEDYTYNLYVREFQFRFVGLRVCSPLCTDRSTFSRHGTMLKLLFRFVVVALKSFVFVQWNNAAQQPYHSLSIILLLLHVYAVIERCAVGCPQPEPSSSSFIPRVCKRKMFC